MRGFVVIRESHFVHGKLLPVTKAEESGPLPRTYLRGTTAEFRTVVSSNNLRGAHFCYCAPSSGASSFLSAAASTPSSGAAQTTKVRRVKCCGISHTKSQRRGRRSRKRPKTGTRVSLVSSKLYQVGRPLILKVL